MQESVTTSSPAVRGSEAPADHGGPRPRAGLRERKKIAALRRIQQRAIEQFEKHGFDHVTIEQIAEAAEVSPSTVYRYYGTKEGLVLRDEHDDAVLAALPALMAEHDPWTALALAVEAIGTAHFGDDADLSLRRVRIWHETPSVRAAAAVVVDQTAKQLAVAMHAADRFGRGLDDYEVLSSSMLAAIMTRLEQWYDAGGTDDFARVVVETLELIRPGWASVAGQA